MFRPLFSFRKTVKLECFHVKVGDASVLEKCKHLMQHIKHYQNSDTYYSDWLIRKMKYFLMFVQYIIVLFISQSDS